MKSFKLYDTNEDGDRFVEKQKEKARNFGSGEKKILFDYKLDSTVR